MLKNILTIAFRNVMRNKTFSIINLLGLVMGLTFSLLIFLWVNDEWQVDKFHANGDRLYRVLQTQFRQDGLQETSYQTPFLLAEALKTEMPEVSHATVLEENRITLRKDETMVSESGIYTGPDFWLMFSFPLIKGSTSTALSSADNIVISDKLAKKLFGNDDPLGKNLRVDNQKNYYVSGVFADVPHASSLQFDFILSFKELEAYPWSKDWGAIGNKTFILLHPEASMVLVNKKIKDFLKGKQVENKDQLSLQPYEWIYPRSNFRNGPPEGGRIEYVRLFTIVGILILLVACINFMNLSTVQSVKRSKEVGIRKVIGAQRKQLIAQFMGEAILMVSFALILSLVIIEALLPAFNLLTGKQIVLTYNVQLVSVLIAISLFIGFVAGSYPALFLSSLKPVGIVKGNFQFKPGATLARKTLVTVQFVLSFLFITATFVIHKQMEYIQNKNLGFDRNNLVTVGINNSHKTINALKNDLLQSPLIKSVTYSNQTALDVTFTSIWVDWPGKDPNRELNFAFAGVGYDYLSTLGIQLKEGRDFSPEISDDTLNVIINEEAAKQTGLAEPLGTEITTTRDLVRKGKIIGIVKDFHLQSMHAPIVPLYLFLDTWPNGAAMAIRVQPGKTGKGLEQIERTFKKHNPDDVFNYTFTSEKFRQQYASESLLQTLSNAFSLLAISISCLGLFGLVAFSADQRTKEIGIRKVMGASSANIVELLSKDFMKLILLALIFAIPAALFLTNQWLNNFTYRTELRWTIFAVSAIALLAIAMLTVGIKSLRAAQANPIDSLRNE